MSPATVGASLFAPGSGTDQRARTALHVGAAGVSGSDPVRWRGEFVVVHWDGSWRFGRCVCCGRKLTDDASMVMGIGPLCVRREQRERGEGYTEWLAGLIDGALRQDRTRWRFDRLRRDFPRRRT